MNDKEKKAIEEIGLIIEAFYDFPNPQSIDFNCKDCNYLETVLNLIEKQKAEISDLKWKNEIYVKSIKSHDRYEIELNDEIIEKNNKIFDLEAKIEKKDKVIDLMAKELVKAHEWFYSEFDNYTKEGFNVKYSVKVDDCDDTK